MKHLALSAIVGTFLVGTGAVVAQNTRRPAPVVPFKGNVPSKIKRPQVTPTPSGKIAPGPIIGERFHLKIWSVLRPGAPLGSNQKVAFFGTLKLDRQVRWKVEREQAPNHERGPGESLEISEDAAARQGGGFNFSALYGSSPHRRVDLLFSLSSVEGQQIRKRAVYLDSVDLLKESGKTYFCKNGGGDTFLYVKVERTGYVYGLRIQRPLPTPTPKAGFRHPGPHRN